MIRMRPLAHAIVDFQNAFVTQVTDVLNALNQNRLVYPDMAHTMVTIDPTGKTQWDAPLPPFDEDRVALTAMDRALQNISFDAITNQCGFQAGWHVLQAFQDQEDVQGSVSVVFNGHGKVLEVFLLIEDVHLFETFMRHGMEPELEPEPEPQAPQLEPMQAPVP